MLYSCHFNHCICQSQIRRHIPITPQPFYSKNCLLHQEAGLCVHVRQIYVSFAANDAEEASNEQQQVQQWRLTPEQAGPIRMLQWGGISRSTPQWPSRWGMLYRGTLHLLENETSAEPLESLNIWNNRWERRS